MSLYILIIKKVNSNIIYHQYKNKYLYTNIQLKIIILLHYLTLYDHFQ